MRANTHQHGSTRGWVALTALLLVALWLPATSHDWLEAAGWIHSPEALGQELGHDAADGHCRLDHAVVLVKAPTLTPQSWLTVVPDAALSFAPQIFFFSGTVVFHSTAPPDLLTMWSFARRTALPSRAPSLTA